MLRMWIILVIPLVLGGCDRGDDGRVKVDFQPHEPEGVTAELAIEHHPKTTFGQITQIHPESSFAGAVVIGPSFQSPSDVYVLTLMIDNRSNRPVSAPDVYLLPAQALAGEPEVCFRAKSRELRAGKQILRFYWDPGQAIGAVKARLAWAP